MKLDFGAISLDRTSALSVFAYGLSICVCLLLIWLSLDSLIARYAAYSAMADRLALLESRLPAGSGPVEATGEAPQGTPYLEGDSLTIAGAALQKRVTSAIEEDGGTVLSSQIELQPEESATDRVSLLISFEVEQEGLQKILYNLEAGAPLLLIDRLAIQSPSSAQEQSTRLRITMSVTGQWQQTQ
jgi:general secretion pathway protein M